MNIESGAEYKFESLYGNPPFLEDRRIGSEFFDSECEIKYQWPLLKIKPENPLALSKKSQTIETLKNMAAGVATLAIVIVIGNGFITLSNIVKKGINYNTPRCESINGSSGYRCLIKDDNGIESSYLTFPLLTPTPTLTPVPTVTPAINILPGTSRG